MAISPAGSTRRRFDVDYRGEISDSSIDHVGSSL